MASTHDSPPLFPWLRPSPLQQSERLIIKEHDSSYAGVFRMSGGCGDGLQRESGAAPQRGTVHARACVRRVYVRARACLMASLLCRLAPASQLSHVNRARHECHDIIWEVSHASLQRREIA